MIRPRRSNEKLRALLHESRWTHEAFARAVNASGARTGERLAYDRTSVSHWLAGTVPRRSAVPAICEAFSQRLKRIVVPQDVGLGLPEDCTSPHPDLSQSPAQAITSLLAVSSQRPLRPLTDYEVLGPPPTRCATTTESEPERFFQILLSTHGTACVRDPLRSYLAHITGPQLADSPSPACARHGAALTLLLGRAHEGELAPGAAQLSYLTAMTLARHADDLRLWALAVGALSSQATSCGHHRPAHRLAQIAATAARTLPPNSAAVLLAQLAVSTAHMRQVPAAKDLLMRARLLASRIGAGENALSPLGPCTRTRASVEHFAAQAEIACGNDLGAIRALERALVLVDPADHQGSAHMTAALAHLLAETGRRAASLSYAPVILGAPSYARSAVVTALVQRWDRSLQASAGNRVPVLQAMPS